jgi:hypothetical protein
MMEYQATMPPRTGVPQVQGGHGALVEPQVRVRLPGHRDHLRRQVDPKGGQPERVQVCRHAAGAATEISDRPGTGGLHEFGERRKQRTVQRLRRKLGAQPLGVVDGDGVVGRPDGA